MLKIFTMGFIILVGLTSCNLFVSNADTDTTSQKIDSIQRVKLMDTSNMKLCPIEITNSIFVPGRKEIRLNYHNSSAWKIRRIEFSWYGLDADNKPADNGLGNTGVSGGIDDNGLDSGANGTGTWPAGGKKMVKMVAVWPAEVTYADGTWWHAGKY